MPERSWEFWIDVGGTFTDCLGQMPDGEIRRLKWLSSGAAKGGCDAGSTAARILDTRRQRDPHDFWEGHELRLLDSAGNIVGQSRVNRFDPASGAFELVQPLAAAPEPNQNYELVSDNDAPIVAIRYLLGLAPHELMPPVKVRLGTTRGTNALLTRRGARTALVTTSGLADLLEIGYQSRPQLFALDIRKPSLLHEMVVEIDERIAADGQVLRAPRREQIVEALTRVRNSGIDSLAICLMHAYREPKHEQLVADVARELGFCEISLSSQIAPHIKIVARAETTVADAYLNPVLRQYVARLRSALGAGELRLMTSAGGLVGADDFRGADSILSGPAGGVVGFAQAAQRAGFARAIGFDMGGTSTDVARFEGRFELEYETQKAGVRVVAPMLAIETVAAGGGSICGFDGLKLVVGPQSAGADPGPACYGRGGPLAVTDVNFYLGRLLPEHFAFPLDRGAVASRLRALSDEVAAATEQRLSPDQLCDGFLRVANANMVEAIRSISVARGYDPREHVLVAFGGAAGQHATAVAAELGIRQVLLHPDASLLSAYGIGQADITRHGSQGVYRLLDEVALQQILPEWRSLEATARGEVLAEGAPEDAIECRRSLDLRYRGLDAFLTIETPSDGDFRLASDGDFRLAYEQEHRRLYGYVQTDRPIEIVAMRVEVVGRTVRAPQRPPEAPRSLAKSSGTRQVSFAGVRCDVPVYDRAALVAGAELVGPALVYEALSCNVIEPDWRVRVLEAGELLLTHEESMLALSAAVDFAVDHTHDRDLAVADPVLLEIFNNQFAGIAEQMGITLRSTSSSVNVKERLDFSCALFTASGELVVNAPHIPVHLGAMGETVRHLLADNPAMRVGDVFVTNDPYRGGSHLPDITVVTPVFDEPSGELRFMTASRAHHAELGGVRPGSMPPFSRRLSEEGVLISNFRLFAVGESRLDEFRELLLRGPYPTRQVDDNLADVMAQVAANRQGSRDLQRMVEREGWPCVRAYMEHVQHAAEIKLRRALARLPAGVYRFEDHLDDGARICVAIDVHGNGATLDFTGTSPVLDTNLNANRAIVTAATMYVLRLLIDEDIPLNAGVLRPVQLVLPECLLNPQAGPSPEQSPAVVGGNVETSQRVVDVLLGALALAAASQGTMNNLTFGDATFGYYETICGGAGATPRFAGADAVHTHMTNTRLTDPEVLEQRYPVRLREFAVRRGSGGAGQHRGGDGIVRRIEFLRPLELSLLTQRRGPYAPFGLAGGKPGALGRQSVVRVDGQSEELAARATTAVAPGDVLTIETPGGGGWGEPST